MSLLVRMPSNGACVRQMQTIASVTSYILGDLAWSRAYRILIWIYLRQVHIHAYYMNTLAYRYMRGHIDTLLKLCDKQTKFCAVKPHAHVPASVVDVLQQKHKTERSLDLQSLFCGRVLFGSSGRSTACTTEGVVS